MTPRPARSRSRLERGLRVAADAVLVPAAMTLAVATRFLGFLLIGGERLARVGGADQLWRDSLALWPSTLLLTPLALAVFALHGFYTRGRFYAGRYKAVTIVQAVTVLFLLWATLAYALKLMPAPPRGAYVAAYLWVLGLVGGARLWIVLWRWASPSEAAARRATYLPDGRRVLVIGGAGYIGSALVPLLLDRGYRVHVLDALLYGKRPIAEYLPHPRFRLTQADFRHVNSVVAACKEADAIVHLGGIVGDPACAVDEELTVDVNLSATRMIAEVAKGFGVNRFVFASTCSVYGARDEMLDERSSLSPVSLYARTKIASERLLQELHGPDLPVVLLRFATIFGLSGRIRFDLVVNLLTAQAAIDRRITVKGGDQWRPFVHVQDAAHGIVAALDAPTDLVGGGTFNVGGNANNMQIQQLGELVQRLVPESELVSLPADGDRRNYRVAFDHIHRTLGFQVQWSVEQGIQQVLEALRDGRVTDFRDPQYSNYQSLVSGMVSLPRNAGEWEQAYLSGSYE